MSIPVAEARVEIAAPIEGVWRVMLDVERYGEWNPFVYRVEAEPGAMRVGSTFRLFVRWAKGGVETSDEVVTRLDAPRLDGGRWRGYWEYRFTGILSRLGLVRAVRIQHVEQEEGGPTRWLTREEFRGALAMFVPIKKVQAGFDAHAAALKERAESIARGGGAGK